MAQKKSSSKPAHTALSNEELLSKLRSIGVRVEGEDAHIDTDVIQAILQGKKLPHPREVIIRDEPTPRAQRPRPILQASEPRLTKRERRAVKEIGRSIIVIERNLNALEEAILRTEAKLDYFESGDRKI